MFRNNAEAADNNVASSLQEVHTSLSQIRISDDEQGQDETNLDINSFLHDFEEDKQSLERHIESHKDTKLPINQDIFRRSLQLANGILQLDLQSFSSSNQSNFAGYLLDILGYNNDFDANYMEILRDLQSEKLKILGNTKSSPAKPQRYMEDSLCICPSVGYAEDICISQAVKRLLRAALQFYNMAYVNRKIFRDSAVVSLKNYKHKVRQTLTRIQYLAESRRSPLCARLTVDRTATMSTPSSRLRQLTIVGFLTPRQTPRNDVAATTDQQAAATARRSLDFGADVPSQADLTSDSD